MPGFLHNTCAVMRRETGRITRQPMYFVLMIVLPVVSFAFFALLFNQGAIRNIPIAVLDQDNTTLSRKAVQMIDDTPTAMVAYGIQGMDEGERLMREGRIMAIVQIPAFFEKNILSNSQTRLENYVSGTNITVNGLLSKDIQTAVTTFTAGIQLQVLMKQGLTQRQAMAQLMPVRFDKHVLFNPHINYGYYLSPSFMPMMLMIFVVMVTVFAIGTELKHATAREWHGKRFGRGGARGQGAAHHGGDVPDLAGDAGDQLQNRGNAAERQSCGDSRRHAALHFELPVDLGADRLAAGQPAPVALDRRRIFGAGLHLLGTDVPDHGHVGADAVGEQDLPVHLLHRYFRRPDAPRHAVGLLAARPLLHVAVHRFTAPVPAAPEKGLHGGKILGEIVI